MHTSYDQFQTSDKIDEQIKQMNVNEAHNLADSSCTNGYNNDGSTGFDIFENGFKLAKKAKDKPVYITFIRDERVSLFFIGTEKEILTKLRK